MRIAKRLATTLGPLLIVAAVGVADQGAERRESEWTPQSATPADGVRLRGAISVEPDGAEGRRAWALEGTGRVEVEDAGDRSRLDVGLGETVSLAAWVALDEIGAGQNVYLVGKGRTRAGSVNQNYALRLRNEQSGQGAGVSFLFRSRGASSDGESGGWHRWTSSAGIYPGGGWHHVAVCYTFGDAGSLRAWIDGIPVSGRWDMDGASDAGPVVDDDPLWIGSSLGGSRSNGVRGRMGPVSLVRGAVDDEEVRAIAERWMPLPEMEESELETPEEGVVAALYERMPTGESADFFRPAPTVRWDPPAMATHRLPTPYDARGERSAYAGPIQLTVVTRDTLPAGPIQLVMRGLPAGELRIDGEPVLTVAARATGGFDRPVPDPPESLGPGVRWPRPGDAEAVGVWESDGEPHRFEAIWTLGGNRRMESGEAAVAWRPVAEGDAGALRLLGASDPAFTLTDAGWERYQDVVESQLAEADRVRRVERLAFEAEYWDRRHRGAAEWAERQRWPEVPETESDARSFVDRFLERRAEEAGAAIPPRVSDATFLRRACLDLQGTIPTAEQVARYGADPEDERRVRLVRRLLDGDGPAHAWMPQWLDVLAENPNILNPTLNNTGPFRFFLHEALLDGEALDRLVTRLVRQGGHPRFGGPAGFGVASQNDVPMAARALVLSKALLAREMGCARCHDAPFHEARQSDLFGLAAMLGKKSIAVPATSSLPADPDVRAQMSVAVTLEPGERVDPHWPLADVVREERVAEWITDPEDSRERLAALLTAPPNLQFARVAVNRLWHHLMGWGLVEPLDDWETTRPSHPDLLEYLALDFVAHGYDLRHTARRIAESEAYSRRAVEGDAARSSGTSVRCAPVARMMTAEQMVDSIHVAVGKPLRSDELNLDHNASRPISNSINLGVPTRAWQMTSMSNERDRPTLRLPRAQAVVDVLEVFGWQSVRQSASSREPPAPGPLQPAALQNGLLLNHAVRLTPGAETTDLALDPEVELDAFVDRIYQRVLSRPPSEEERGWAVAALEPGFGERIVKSAEASRDGEAAPRRAVSWSHHLHEDAAAVQEQIEQWARDGRPVTDRLDEDWRERCEDLLWALLNSPEMISRL